MLLAHHNDWDTSVQRSESSSSITSSFDTKTVALIAKMAEINKNLMRVLQVNQQVKAVTPNCETCGGPHSFNDYPAIVSNTQNVYAAGAYQGGSEGITTRSGTVYQGPTIPNNSYSPVVERETEATKDKVHPTNNGSTEDVQPPVVPTESLILNFEPVISPIIEPVASPVSASKPNQRPSIPYPSRLQDQNFADALIIMLKFGPSIKSLLTNKDKLYELARTPLNEHCSTVLLKKFPKKLGDPGKFLIPYDFPRMAEFLALVDLGASINLMPLSVWNKLSLSDFSPTCMTLELVDRSISHPVGVSEDVFIKVGTFHFPADFVVVDFDADPRVPLILWISFLKTKRALVDVLKGKLTLRVGKEAITFNLDQTSRYSSNYNDMAANRIDVIDMACEEYSQEVLGFSDVIASGNPTPYYDPIVFTTSSTLTPFENSDFILEEVDAFLALEDDPTLLEVDQSYVDTEGEILLLEAFLNDDPSLLPPNQGNYKFEGIDPEFCTYKIFMEEDFEPAVQHQRRANPKIHDVIKNEVLKLFDAKLIYPISNSPWVSPVHSVPKKGSFTVVENKENELILTHLSRVGMSASTIDKTTCTCPYGMFAYRRMPFGLCNAPGSNYTTKKKEMFAVVYAFKKSRSYLIMNKSIVYTNHFALKYLFAKKDSKARFLRWVLFLQEFTFKVIDTKVSENLAADHLSQLENPHQNVLDPKEINESFPLETLNLVSSR
nr:reverse transcriptase domain-containing protein [Tanacetum cinerariifolium]